MSGGQATDGVCHAVPGRADSAGAAGLLASTLHSDRLYFEAGAHLTEAEGFTLATVPGFERLAAGNAGFLERWPPGAALRSRICEIEALFRAASASRVRFYAPAPGPGQLRHMARLGYTMREERAYGFRAAPACPSPGLTMGPVLSDADWAAKLELQRSSGLPSDGHVCAPQDWVALERLKAASSNLAFYRFQNGGRILAAVAFLPVSPHVVRLKNLLVRADARRQGVARDVLKMALGRVFDMDAGYMVLLGIRGSPGDHLYRAAGGRDLGSVYEFSRATGHEDGRFAEEQ